MFTVGATCACVPKHQSCETKSTGVAFAGASLTFPDSARSDYRGLGRGAGQAEPLANSKSEDQEPVRVFTEEIRLPVAAKDSFGHYDPTLNTEDVLVLEDGQPQQIRSIQHLPANVLLLLDLGNQLGLKDTNLTRQVAMDVVSALYAGSRIAIMQFASRPELLQTWTSDREAIAKVLKTKLKSGKSSRLSDAFVAAADQFKAIPPGTRHIVIITDGVEAPGSQTSMATAMRTIKLGAGQRSHH